MHFSSVALPSTLFNTAGAGQQVYSVGKTLGRVKDSHRSIGVCVMVKPTNAQILTAYMFITIWVGRQGQRRDGRLHLINLFGSKIV